jgi:hypothetical protein
MSNRSGVTADVIPGADASIVRRLFWLPLWLFVGLAGAVLIGILFVSWHSLQRLEPIAAHLHHIERIQSRGAGHGTDLAERVARKGDQPIELHELGAEVRQIAEREGALHPRTPARLHRIATQLGAAQDAPSRPTPSCG